MGKQFSVGFVWLFIFLTTFSFAGAGYASESDYREELCPPAMVLMVNVCVDIHGTRERLGMGR